jgi:hypothetical protein
VIPSERYTERSGGSEGNGEERGGTRREEEEKDESNLLIFSSFVCLSLLPPCFLLIFPIFL